MIRITTGAVTLSLMASTALAGGIERTAQSVAPIFESGNYAEISVGSANPSITGTAAGQDSGNIGLSFTQVGLAVKTQINENLSFGLIYDQPYGADVAYATTTTYPLRGLNASLDSNAVTALARYTFGNGFGVHAGVRHQTIEANIAVPAAGGYTATAGSGSGTGYVAGVSYERPEIAMRIALTYNSEIESTHSTSEATTTPVLASTTDTLITTPKSWNLEAQSGIAPGTLLFGSVRWVNWSDFVINPSLYNTVTGVPIL